MPSLMDLRSRMGSSSHKESTAIPGEILVADVRGSMTPVQVVDQKLRVALGRDSSLSRRSRVK